MKMAYHLSSKIRVAEHKELQANAMSLDRKGKFAVLAGRRNIAIIDLDKPDVILRKNTRSQQKYNVTAVEWNPNSQLRDMFALATGEKTEIIKWYDGSLSNGAILKAHTRTITDLNWHHFEPNLLATCSIDTFLHVWDIRERHSHKPAISFSAIAGASQVKWNRLEPDILASGHDCDIRIWDRRKCKQPIQYINAHLSKIHGLDWSPNNKDQIVSSSNDTTVRFFDVNHPRKSEIFINTQSPVWRARYTPFGEAIVTVLVPPLRRGDNSLLLWSMLDTSSGPVHNFVGHSDIVLEFEWRQEAGENEASPTEFQLVTWARDNSLRIWRLDPQLLKMCGHSLEEENHYPEEGNLESSDTDTLIGFMEVEIEDQKEDETTKELGWLDCQEKRSPVCKTSQNTPTPSISSNTTIGSEKRIPPRSLSLCESPMDPLSLSPDTPGPHSLSQTPCGTSEYDTPTGNSSAYGLLQEFMSLTNSNSFDKNVVDIVSDVEKRLCQVTVKHGSSVAVLGITFPPKYPNGSCPNFRFSNGTNIDATTKTELLKVLKNTALQYRPSSIRKKKGCLEKCISIFINKLKALAEERSSGLGMGIPGAPIHTSNCTMQFGGPQDSRIPFPRTSGARFCGSGALVCFTRPTFGRHGLTRERSTPRSLSALAPHVTSLFPQMSSSSATSPKVSFWSSVVGQSPSMEQNVSISMYYYQDRKYKSKRTKGGGRSQHFGHVTVYDVSKLIPISRELASAYVLYENDMVASCFKNRDAAASLGRKDLAQVWSLVGSSLSVQSMCGADEDFPWIGHPFGMKMIISLIDHYHARFDVQTAAILSCVLAEKNQGKERKLSVWRTRGGGSSSGHSKEKVKYRRNVSVTAKLEMLSTVQSNETGGSPYNTIHAMNSNGLELSTSIRHSRSNSEGSLAEAARPATESLSFAEGVLKKRENTVKGQLDPAKANQYNDIRVAYANILYCWNLLEQRAMVNKYTREYTENRCVEFRVKCTNCEELCKDAFCKSCKKLAHVCCICRLYVKGSSNFCLICGHGGHTQHLYEWFSEFEECPEGCGCQCLKEMEEIFS